jgi:hypothetical protein
MCGIFNSLWYIPDICPCRCDSGIVGYLVEVSPGGDGCTGGRVALLTLTHTYNIQVQIYKNAVLYHVIRIYNIAFVF